MTTTQNESTEMNMFIKPLSQKIYNKCISLGITDIDLIWEGGSDEGVLTIQLDGTHDAECEYEMTQMIEEWAIDAYIYNGGGDGTPYGDNISYDLVNKTATHEGGEMERTTYGGSEEELEIAQETTQQEGK